MKAAELYKTVCTLFGSASGYILNDRTKPYIQQEMKLYEIFAESRKLKAAVEKIRSMEYHSEEYTEAKKKIPCYVLGTFGEGRKDADLVKMPQLIVIDIDDIEYEKINEYRKKIFELPYVLCTCLSVGGKGFYALVAVEDGKLRKQYYKKIAKVWQMKFGIKVDAGANSIGRKRFCSYEDGMTKWMKKPDEDITLWDILPIEKHAFDDKPTVNVYNIPVKKATNNDSLSENKDFCEAAAKKALEILTSELKEYKDWELLAERLKNFECDMWEDFCRCCANSPRTNRVGGWKKDLYGLKKVFAKEKANSWTKESTYFFKVLKDAYGNDWIKIVQNTK